ncbi:methyltransferase [Desulfonema ishimotonii]|uniref:Methyltransferase n=1 Tax=Desulfonema ishimotonii TaxID=45657 RepID=A0A401FYG4_9BACT|nr:nicotianamine synthase family protein [Desulfonema ishimotonii]GBC62008.1 methyltransferase [Desulfonema ishimotonii]
MTAPEGIRREFTEIYEAIRHLTDAEILTGPEASFRPHFERLNRLVARSADDEMAETLRRNRSFEPVIRRISHLRRINGLRLELAFARSLLTAPDPWKQIEAFVYYPNYLELARMERQGGELRAGDRVVFLGSGPLPMSLICLCRQYGISGVGIEQDAECVRISDQLIGRLGLSGHIRILCGDHFSLPLSEPCKLVMVGADALPKAEIFAHLAATLPDQARVSYRIYEKGLRRLMDVRSDFELPSQFRKYARIRPEPPVNNTAVFTTVSRL